MESVLDHAARGGAVMGICNGFQILLETGLLPGVLVENAGLKYVCRNTAIEVADSTASPFTAGLTPGQKLIIPVAHNEGNYFALDDDLQRLEDNGQIAFRYTDSDIIGPANPNGAARNIAGILSPNGRVMGMMPHPERAIAPALGSADGATMLTATLEALAA
jgi:phosphoribosylformylglycinamidine synthase